ncbi:MAG TPA: glucosamine-6-phosphate deaminase [Afifellaceae bacterium]|nr:glucosamine-6-phosphate deaminase [Afifellaceae bacterium]
MPEPMILDDEAAVADFVAALVAERLAAQPRLVLGLATGQTFMAVYERLVALHRRGAVSFAQATSFNLDEYAGLPADHPASYHAFMRRCLFGQVDNDPGRAHLPDGMAADLDAEAARYEAAIRAAGGVSLQLLGIGENGHIGFNEPGAAFSSRTRVVALEPSTQLANSRFFPAGEEVPRRAITMGVATIMEAREIVLAATGGRKAAALTAALAGPVTPACPASVLRRHRRATIVCDREAASQLLENGGRATAADRRC